MLDDQDIEDDLIDMLEEEIDLLREMLLRLAGVVVVDVDFVNHVIIAHKVTVPAGMTIH